MFQVVPVGEHTQKLMVVHKTLAGKVLKTPVMSVVKIKIWLLF